MTEQVKEPHMVSFAEDDMLDCMTKNMFIDSIPDDIDSFIQSLIGKSGGKHVAIDDD